jgi:hypothetical protein
MWFVMCLRGTLKTASPIIDSRFRATFCGKALFILRKVKAPHLLRLQENV